MDLEKYVDKYYNVSRKEMEKIRDCSRNNELLLQSQIQSRHRDRECEKIYGRPALRCGPLIQVLSVSLEWEKQVQDPLIIYGKINVEFEDSIYGGIVGHAVYNRGRDVAEIIGLDGSLSLNGPDYPCRPRHAFVPLFRSRLIVELFDGGDNLFARECVLLDDYAMVDDFEDVKSMVIPCEQGSLIVDYIRIPFGINCRIEVMFCHKEGSPIQDFININGKISAHYANIYGNCSSQECVLFSKQTDEFGRVEIGPKESVQLSRCWVAVPAYSSLVIRLDLSEFESGRKIVDDSIQLLAQPGLMYGDTLVMDDVFIQVGVSWFPPPPLRPHEYKFSPDCLQEMPIEETEQMDVSSSSSSSYESSPNDESSCHLNNPWVLDPHKIMPLSSPAVEIFSVLIGRENSKALQLHGSIEVLCNENRICFLFKRERSDLLCLSKDTISIPILDGSRVYEDFNSLEIKFDIKDDDENFAVKGYVAWYPSDIDGDYFRDKQLCSLIQGKNGFVAMHYSVFSEAVAANIKLFVNSQMGLDDIFSKAYGNIIAEYNHYDYSSRYSKDYNRNVLFMRSRDESIRLHVDGEVPLSRSMVVVPVYSNLILNVDLSCGVWDYNVSCVKHIPIGIGRTTLETSFCSLRIEVDWCVIK